MALFSIGGVPDERRRRFLFVAIARAARWVHLEIRDSKSSDVAATSLRDEAGRCPIRPRIVLKDNDNALTDRLLGGSACSTTGRHLFVWLAAAHEIEHRLIRPGLPGINGMVERLNGRIVAILQRHRYTSRRDLDHPRAAPGFTITTSTRGLSAITRPSAR